MTTFKKGLTEDYTHFLSNLINTSLFVNICVNNQIDNTLYISLYSINIIPENNPLYLVTVLVL